MRYYCPHGRNEITVSLEGNSVSIALPARAAEISGLTPVAEAMRQFAVSALRGNTSILYVEAEKCFAAATQAESVTILVRSGGEWRPWHTLSEDAGGVSVLQAIPDDAIGWDRVRRLAAGALFVPVRPGVVAALIQLDDPSRADHAELAILASALNLALTTCERQCVASESVNETQVLHRVATRILSSHDLEEILLLITQETKRLLAADICGILLRDGEEIVMRRCVGNLSPATAALRMHQGQGLAGRVFATGESCCVDDYVESTLISRDFFGLAQAEKVRSALGAPLISKDAVIGVLEVWRRRPSIFTEQDTSRLVALVNLTSIAIENARLYAEQRSMVHELAEANRGLADRFEVIRGLADLQRDLVQLLIDGRNLAAIAAHAAEHLGANVLIVDLDLRLLGASPPVSEIPPTLRAPLLDALRYPLAGAAASSKPGATLHTQRITIGNEPIGLVAAFGERLDDAAGLAVSQVAMAAALFRVEQRAASKAQAETLEVLLWDLLEGPDAVRHAALDRARQMHVEPKTAVRVFVCSLAGIEDLAKVRGWGAGEVEACRRRVRDLCEQQQDGAAIHRLVGTRGNQIVFLMPDRGTDASERAAHALALAIAREVPGLSAHVGASGPQPDALALRKSFSEARISAEVAGQHGRAGGAVFERGGVVGVLLSLRQESDIKGMVERTFGRLLQVGERQRQVLLKTLQVFFECNCSQQAAARQLRVHHKTVRYRLDRISELTGLDLTTREDRLLADLALYVNELTTGK